jgi:hypothetical protein
VSVDGILVDPVALEVVGCLRVSPRARRNVS